MHDLRYACRMYLRRPALAAAALAVLICRDCGLHSDLQRRRDDPVASSELPGAGTVGSAPGAQFRQGHHRHVDLAGQLCRLLARGSLVLSRRRVPQRDRCRDRPRRARTRECRAGQWSFLRRRRCSGRSGDDVFDRAGRERRPQDRGVEPRPVEPRGSLAIRPRSGGRSTSMVLSTRSWG